ncbi:TPA: hypothetical protein ACXI1D_000033 [Proteus mirabilis]
MGNSLPLCVTPWVQKTSLSALRTPLAMICCMHRIPPQLMVIIPQGSSSLGDIEKAAMVFWFNELLPLMESMKSINDMLGIEVIRFKQYACWIF